MASPFIFNHDPNCLNLSSNIGTIIPSFVGPTLIKILPPQLVVLKINFFKIYFIHIATNKMLN